MTQLKKISFAFMILSFTLVSQGFAQKKPVETKKVNFGYSTNPPAKVSKKTQKKKLDKTDNQNISLNNNAKRNTKNKSDNEKIESTKTDDARKDVGSVKSEEIVSIAKKTREVSKRVNRANLLPTEIYKVGVGDVLFINLQDTAAKYYTVLIDGTIDYPLAGKLVSVLDLTTEEIEDLLREKVKLYENPQVTVKVREYASHKIQVDGLARVGEHHLQREAMPLVVVKTMVGTKPNATIVSIERENYETKVLNLSDPNTDVFLIEKGDKLVFESDEFPEGNVAKSKTTEFYRVSKKICSGGTKKFQNGITLVQAIFEVCGELNKKLKEVSITRKTASGVFVTKRYKFRRILNGKQADPVLRSGDMIDSVR